ncbi:hypothetical protein Ppa05_12310 [Planomonospora parontospora subsp. antibiotica]|nr:hypothetical protein Ppa05_12310 [Planomonospora parontospora subsp. antibiotica]
MRIVTADGRVLDCDADHDPDLLWASRGGGGGNLGVAVSFGFRTHPAREVTVFTLRGPCPGTPSRPFRARARVRCARPDPEEQ